MMATSPATVIDDAIAAKFARLTTKWKTERGPESSITRISMHPAYQQIIGMGEPVLPLTLQELERSPDHWFWALNAITGADPVPDSGRGVISEMVKAWLDWGLKHGA